MSRGWRLFYRLRDRWWTWWGLPPAERPKASVVYLAHYKQKRKTLDHHKQNG